jgi:hypothetical protein
VNYLSSVRFVIVAARISASEIKLAAAAIMFCRQARRIFVDETIIVHVEKKSDFDVLFS